MSLGIKRETNSTASSLCNACKVEISVLEDIILATEELMFTTWLCEKNFSTSCQKTST